MLNRKKQVVLTKLIVKINHANYTYVRLIEKEEPEKCDILCTTEITVKHFLFDYRKYSNQRRQKKICNDLKNTLDKKEGLELFTNT